MVKLTDRPNMTLDVYRGRKTTTTTTVYRGRKTITQHQHLCDLNRISRSWYTSEEFCHPVT